MKTIAARVSFYLRRTAALGMLGCAALVLAACSSSGSSGSSAPTATAPTITTQPQSATVADGATATFTVVAAGTAPLSYQWQLGGAAISGATAASYTTAALTTANSGTSYTVVVSNSAGSVTSSPATLTVTAAAPTITTQPANQMVLAGATATFTVVAAGTAPLTYQWKSGGTAISGATAASYTTPALTVANSGTSYTVVVTNSAGSVTSSAATVTVTATAVAPTITTQPHSVTVNDGSTATFTVVASGTAPLSYQWKASGTAIAGATAASYTTPALTVANSGTSYTVVVTNSAGSITSSAAIVTVNSTVPTITTQPANQTVTDGATATFTVVAAGTAPLSYQWKKAGTTIAGATAASYTTPALTVANSGTSYTVVVTNSAGSVTSNPATVTVNAVVPTITTQPANRTVNDGATATFTVVANGGSSTLSYQWKKGGVTISGATAASYTTPALTVADSGSSYTVVVSDSAGSVTSNAAIVTVNALAPTITTQPTSQTVMDGATATFTVVANGGSATLSYQWKKGGVTISGATAASYTTPATTPADNGSSFTVVVTDSGGSVTSVAAGLTVTHTLALLAGQIGGTGNVDGTGTAAEFYNPAGLGMDAAGNIYVADSADETIRVISPGGTVTTLAGTPYTPGFVNASTGAGAQFNDPQGVVVDTAGNVYVADEGNNVIRMITPLGVVSTFAGTGVAGYNDGAGATAQFNAPAGIAIDSTNLLYVADENNDVIRTITTPAGVVSTFAGTAGSAGSTDGPATAGALFNSPTGVAVDASFNVYVADWLNSTIREITAGTVSTLAGTAGNYGEANGVGPAASFDGPIGLSVDPAGANLYVADYTNNAIRQVVIASATVSTLAGSAVGYYGFANGTGTAALFLNTAATVVDLAGANVYVADFQNNLIREISVPGAVVSTFAGNIGGRGYMDGAGQLAQFSNPHGIASDAAGNMYVTDTYNNVIRKVSSTGSVTTLAGTAGVPGYFDSTTGTLAQFNFPLDAAADSLGNIYVADYYNFVIRKITPAGAVSTFAGTAGTPGSLNGQGTAASFGHPTGVTTDANNNVYVADYDNDTIRMITPGGLVSTLAGQVGVAGMNNAAGTNATFYGPRDVGCDTAGNVYVTDRQNNVIRKITMPGANVTTLAGTGTAGYLDGAGTTAEFNHPSGLGVDTVGNVYVADYRNHVIRQITPAGVVSTVAGVSTSVGVTPAIVNGPVALPGSLNGPSNLTVLPGTPTTLAVAEAIENSVLLVTLP
jgi:hypothetical protein